HPGVRLQVALHAQLVAALAAQRDAQLAPAEVAVIGERSRVDALSEMAEAVVVEGPVAGQHQFVAIAYRRLERNVAPVRSLRGGGQRKRGGEEEDLGAHVASWPGRGRPAVMNGGGSTREGR